MPQQIEMYDHTDVVSISEHFTRLLEAERKAIVDEAEYVAAVEHITDAWVLALRKANSTKK